MQTRALHFSQWLSQQTWLGWLTLLVAALAYWGGLDGQHIPRNGDEMVYARIARLTAQSGHWLPLVSDLHEMRNTKPPVLFWQAMLAGDWGHSWTLWRLRLPSVLYTMFISAGVLALTWRITGERKLALLASSIYFAFFCTFRYGRPYLTSAAETFWLGLPCWWVMMRALRVDGRVGATQGMPPQTLPSWGMCLIYGVMLGTGLLYKSFALIAPAAAALGVVMLMVHVQMPSTLGQTLTGRLNHYIHFAVVRVAPRIVLSALAALALFAFWFVLDPDPQAVWNEFVVGENVGKMNSQQGYWHTAVAGGAMSLWAQLLAYLQNAGLLMGYVLAWMLWGLLGLLHWLRGGRVDPTQGGLSLTRMDLVRSSLGIGLASPRARATVALATVVVLWLVVFSIPSQRSARYVIAAMPMLAIILAVSSEKLPRWSHVLVGVLNGLALLLLWRMGTVLFAMRLSSVIENGWVWLSALSGLAAVAIGLKQALGSRNAIGATQWLSLASVLSLCSFNAAVAPLGDAPGLFDMHKVNTAVGSQAQIAVPAGFNGSSEMYTFLLAGHETVIYEDKASLVDLLHAHPVVLWLGKGDDINAPPCAAGECKVLSARWTLRSRHKPGEINVNNLWFPQQWLLQREWLLVENISQRPLKQMSQQN